MNAGWKQRRLAAAYGPPPGSGAGAVRRLARPGRWLAVVAAAVTLTAVVPAGAGLAASRPPAGGPGYRATIVRTGYGIPHVPITAVDTYLRIYQLIELFGQGNDIDGITGAQPPPGHSAAASLPGPTGSIAAAQSATPLSAAGLPAGLGSNAIAVGAAGSRDHRHGLLLGNPHFLWAGPERFYQAQLTIPGVLNVEGATFYGMPLVIVGFTSTMTWSLTTPTAFTYTLYQLTLRAVHPAQRQQDPLPGGPGDPDGELNAIYQFAGPGSVPLYGSSYIQVVTWKTGDHCPRAATLLTYSESDNPASPHFADQTELFSHRKWVTAAFCPDQVAMHAVSATVLRGR